MRLLYLLLITCLISVGQLSALPTISGNIDISEFDECGDIIISGSINNDDTGRGFALVIDYGSVDISNHGALTYTSNGQTSTSLPNINGNEATYGFLSNSDVNFSVTSRGVPNTSGTIQASIFVNGAILPLVTTSESRFFDAGPPAAGIMYGNGIVCPESFTNSYSVDLFGPNTINDVEWRSSLAGVILTTAGSPPTTVTTALPPTNATSYELSAEVFYTDDCDNERSVWIRRTIAIDQSPSCIDIESGNEIKNGVNTAVGMGAIYPNPASGEVNIKLSCDDCVHDIEIRDLSGRLVQQLRGWSGPQARLSLADVPVGSYLVTISNQHGSSTQKLVVR